MPDRKAEFFPWFYAISSQNFGKNFEFNCASQIIRSWMFFASKDILLEYHTQNILVDKNSNVCYRDLSDVRSNGESVLRPSFADNLSSGELLASVFDRTVCNQNLDHLFRYSKKLGNRDRKAIKELIESEIKHYNLPFPNHSIDFPAN